MKFGTLCRILLPLVVAAALPVWSAQPVHTRHGMVVTAEPHATDVGVKVLQAGGNAVDAAVAVGFALAVTHPTAGNLGGGGFMLVRMADGRTSFIDFRERAPQAATRNMYMAPDSAVTRDSIEGHRAAGVPGTVLGLEHAWRKFGKKTWSELVLPAARLATQGYALSFFEATSMRNAARGRGGAKGLSDYPESNRIFLRNGNYYEPGETFVQPDLGRTLGRIAGLGARAFYQGETAALLAKDMKANGGLITLDDLKGYRVIERAPLIGSHRGYTIVTAPPPSSGGIGLLQMLGVLEGTGFEKSGAGSAAAVHYMAEATRHYFADRSNLGDPDFVKVPLAGLLSPEHISRIRASIDPERATPSANVKPAVFTGCESDQTTHYSIADVEGNVVAVTYTLNGSYGSKATATGLGFLLNNEMADFAPNPGNPNMYGLVQGEANAIQAGKTPLSTMTPTIVLRDGKPYLVLGSPGGPTIVNTLLEVLVNVIDWKMNVQDAVNWPRFHHQWLPDELRMEPGYSPDTVALLEKRGHAVRRVESQGQCAAIEINDGWLKGAADPRSGGKAAGY